MPTKPKPRSKKTTFKAAAAVCGAGSLGRCPLLIVGLVPCYPVCLKYTVRIVVSYVYTLNWKHCSSAINSSPKLHNSPIACTCITQRTFQEKCVAGLYGVLTVQCLPIMLYFHMRVKHVGYLPDIYKHIIRVYVQMFDCHP